MFDSGYLLFKASMLHTSHSFASHASHSSLRSRASQRSSVRSLDISLIRLHAQARTDYILRRNFRVFLLLNRSTQLTDHFLFLVLKIQMAADVLHPTSGEDIHVQSSSKARPTQQGSFFDMGALMTLFLSGAGDRRHLVRQTGAGAKSRPGLTTNLPDVTVQIVIARMRICTARNKGH